MGHSEKQLNSTAEAGRLHAEGIQALAEERLEDAVFALRRALELDPTLERAWNDLGVLMEALGNPVEAGRCYRRALQVEPRHSEAYANLGLLTLQMDLAHALYRQAYAAF